VSQRAARHHALEQVGPAGQARIENATVLIVGIGGIGCAAASYLASAGVGTLILNDFDRVDESNLGRQFLFGPGDIGKRKVAVAAGRLRVSNPDISYAVLDRRLDGDALRQAVRSADVVLDCCDNFATRFAINDACIQEGRPLISGAAIRMEGQLSAFGPDYGDSPCYRCLYEDRDESLENCSGNGVLGPVPGVIGSAMAVETLKVLSGAGHALKGTLLLYDGGAGRWHSLTISRRADCPACGKGDIPRNTAGAH
jgi:adenylyltransferase/sulfurtransferase